MRCSITGTTMRTGGTVPSHREHRRVGVEPAVEHDRARQAEGEHGGAQPPAVEQRCGDDDGVPSPERDPLQERDRSHQSNGSTPDRTSRPAGRAGREDDEPAGPRGGRRHRRVCDPTTDPRRRPARSSGPPSPATLAASSLVVDQHVDPFAGDDGVDLRRRERRVQEHEVGAHLPHRERGDDEPAVVAAQQADGATRADPAVAQCAGERIAAFPQLPVGDRAGFVVDRHGVRVARRRCRDGALDRCGPTAAARGAARAVRSGRSGREKDRAITVHAPELARDHGYAQPPSTVSVVPVTYEDASLARNTSGAQNSSRRPGATESRRCAESLRDPLADLALGHLRREHTGCERVDPDSLVPAELRRQLAREAEQARPWTPRTLPSGDRKDAARARSTR